MIEIAIVGAGPYGLSMAAHFRRQGIPFRIFGRPMDSWLGHMPKGMLLKSDGFASDIYDPDRAFTLKKFCAEKGIEYSDTGIPVRLETFTSYGLAFRERMVPELEDNLVVSLERTSDGFRLCLDSGETVCARRVVLAVGISQFNHVPQNLVHLAPELLSHSSKHSNLESFKGRSVVIVGGGASATDLAGLLKDAGADTTLVSRRPLRFHTAPSGQPRALWQQLCHPQSGLGPGMRSRFFADAPGAFRYLPENLRLRIVQNHLGPSGGWFAKQKVIGRVPLFIGYAPQHAESEDNRVRLSISSANGTQRELLADHIIAATGYRVDMQRLAFLSAEVRTNVKTFASSPMLSSTFESSVPGLYFVGITAANSFGPLMRFAFGAGFAARQITRHLKKSLARDRAFVPVPSVATITK